MPLHGLGVAAGEHECGTDAALGADGAEDVGRFGALVMRRPGASPSARPAPGDLVLLADTRFVLPPDFYLRAVGQALAEFRQCGGELFLKSSIAKSFWA